MKEFFNRILFSINGHTPETLIDLFEQHARLRPDSTALIYKDEKLSFGQLNKRANQLAHYLRHQGVKEETFVPILFNRSIDMMVGILGVLKAGGAFVPIDPNYPFQRLKFILEDIGATLMVSNIESQSKLPSVEDDLNVVYLDSHSDRIAQFPSKNLRNKIRPDHLAYIIYTSGSTGNPKGVMVEHKSIFNYLLNSRDNFIVKKRKSSGTFIHISYTFDASLKSIFTPLVSGKLAVISSMPSPLVFEDPNLHKYAPYDFIQLTPAHLDFFYAEFKPRFKKPITEKVSIGGEALYLSHFDTLINKGNTLEVVNEYGPTEATVACTGYCFYAGRDTDIPQTIPIGKPIKNVNIHILTENLQPVKPGGEGEICVGGEQVARGYLNRPELTKQKFVPDPFSKIEGAKMYRTGDIGRWLPNGNIEYIGRLDRQVKIRGYRIEIGEVESVLLKSSLVKSAIVDTIGDQDEKQLVAYIVPRGKFDKNEILAELKDQLPVYQIPEKFVEVQSLPITSNGKIDRKLLHDMI